MFWVSLQLLSQTVLILRRTERDSIRNVYWCSCKVILVKILMKLSPTDLRKNSQISYSMKIRPVAVELFHADRRRCMTKLKVAFRNFAKAPKIQYTHSFWAWHKTVRNPMDSQPLQVGSKYGKVTLLRLKGVPIDSIPLYPQNNSNCYISTRKASEHSGWYWWYG